jgi:CheY-like chemotaxis protein
MKITRESLHGHQRLPRIGFGPIALWPRLQNPLGFCLFVTAFYFAYSYGMSFSQACAAPFWFPDSVLLCALLLTQPRRWWLLIVAVLPIRLLVGFSFHVPLWFLLGAFAIDSAKGLLTAAVLRRFIKDPLRLETVREFGVFCLFAVLLIPAAAAFAGAALRHARGYAYWPAWEQWFLGNVLTHLVLDVQLGRISGIELQRQLTASGVRTPVIFLTAHDAPGARERALAAGCTGYFRKTDSGAEVIEAIRRAVAPTLDPTRKTAD